MNRHLIFIKTLLLNSLFYGSVGFLPWLKPYLIEETSIDKWIGFHPYSIYLYLSFFFLIWYSFIKVCEKSVKELSILIPISALMAALFYLEFSTKIVSLNQEVSINKSDTLTLFIYHLINKNDTHMNCLPSLHGAITVICIYYILREKDKLWVKVFYIMWGLAICWSAIAIRQHLSLDIVVGMIYGVLIISLKNVIIKLWEDLKTKVFKVQN